MADQFTQVSTLSSVGTAAHEKLAYFALRPELLFDQVATVRPTNQSHAGATVLFYLYGDLAAATSALTETADPDAVAMSDSTVTVTLVEYGNSVRTTAKARGTALLELDADAANVIGYNAGLTLDTLARTELVGGTNVIYADGQTATANLTAGDTLGASEIRQAIADLRAGNSKPWSDGCYMGFIHPDQSFDLREETGAAGWSEAAINAPDGNGRVWQGVVGKFAGAWIVETPRVPINADAGASNYDTYDAVFVGQEALAKAHAIGGGVAGDMPRIVVGPHLDKLRRFNSIGWYWLGGYKRFREASIVRVESISSIGANA